MPHSDADRLLRDSPHQRHGLLADAVEVGHGDRAVDAGVLRRCHEVVEGGGQAVGPEVGRIDLHEQRAQRAQAAA
jgi:hypothetical protein